MTGPENDRQRYVAALTAVAEFSGLSKLPLSAGFMISPRRLLTSITTPGPLRFSNPSGLGNAAAIPH